MGRNFTVGLFLQPLMGGNFTVVVEANVIHAGCFESKAAPSEGEFWQKIVSTNAFFAEIVIENYLNLLIAENSLLNLRKYRMASRNNGFDSAEPHGF